LGVVLQGTLAGSLLPIFLKRIIFNSRTLSVPFVAKLVDGTGALIYFSVAYLFLKGVLL
jgi:magnesium transporter